MFIKSHLNFVGNREKKEISFHNINGTDTDILVEVDNFDKIWNYFFDIKQKRLS